MNDKNASTRSNRLRRRSALLGLLAVPLAFTGLTASTLAAPLPVTTTTTMLTDMVKEVGGNRVKVDGLMAPGVDPHLFKPTAPDVLKLSRAKVIFYNGLMLEGKMADLFGRMSKRGTKVVAVASAIPNDQLLHPSDFEGHADPHVWGDSRLWAKCVDVVVKTLSDADPAGRAYFAERGAAYQKQLIDLHSWATKRFAEVPKERRVLVTSHDAFNYLGRAYDLDVVGLQGISTESEPGLADIAKMVDLIKARKVKSIFVESSVAPTAIKRIAKDAGVSIGGELFSDACGTPGEKHTAHGETYDVGTYLGMMKHNVNTAVDALK